MGLELIDVDAGVGGMKLEHVGWRLSEMELDQVGWMLKQVDGSWSIFRLILNL